MKEREHSKNHVLLPHVICPTFLALSPNRTHMEKLYVPFFSLSISSFLVGSIILACLCFYFTYQNAEERDT